MSNKDGPTVSKTVSVTGGGAYKFADLIKEKLQLQVSKSEEIECICWGANFLLKVKKDSSMQTSNELKNSIPSFRTLWMRPFCMTGVIRLATSLLMSTHQTYIRSFWYVKGFFDKLFDFILHPHKLI
jgi:hypothetical protein